jgi:hypothetical protein
MKHNPNIRRGRNRGNGKRFTSVRNQTFESNGPDGKIRGTAQQVLDRYLALGRDATSSGDPVAAESFFQHAEHYFRMLSAEGPQEGTRPPVDRSQNFEQRSEDESMDDGQPATAAPREADEGAERVIV